MESIITASVLRAAAAVEETAKHLEVAEKRLEMLVEIEMLLERLDSAGSPA